MNRHLVHISGIILFSIFLPSQDGFSFSARRTFPIGNEREIRSPDFYKASVFVKMSPAEFAAATGKKLNFFEKIYFRVIQRHIKHDLKANPDLLINDYLDPKKVKFKFSLLWFVIGTIIGPFGVLFAYTSRQQKKETTTKKDKITSAWLGLILFIIWFGFLFVF
jgi:hypothetical protein